MPWRRRWRRMRSELYARGWIVGMIVNMVTTLLSFSLGMLFVHQPLVALLLGLGLILIVLGWLFFGLEAPTLQAAILTGGVERRGLRQTGEDQVTFWDCWLEITLHPRQGLPATVPPEPLQGALQISGRQSERFKVVALLTQYTLPPDTLRLLDGHGDRLPLLTITRPLRVLLVASCETSPWEPSMPPDQDQIHVVLPIADEDYAPVALTARLQRGADHTTWRVV